MSFLDYFRLKPKTSSASIAKERLQIIVSHQRAERIGEGNQTKSNRPDYLPKLQKELLEVISKYVDIDPSLVKVDFSKDDTHSVLELNIALPEAELELVE